MTALKFIRVGVLALLLMVTSLASADSPTDMLQGVADRMLAQLAQHKAQLKKNPAIIHRIVDEVLVPVIDVNRMAGMVVGRQYWYSAQPEARRAFVALFQRLVINTYAGALASYDDDRVVIYPVRGSAVGRTLSVDSTIIRKNGRRIGISYQLIATPGGWKVYDFSVEGVSIVSNYHAQFSNTLASGGMTQLVHQLSQRMGAKAS